MDDLVEQKLEMLFRDLKPYADKSIGSLRIGMDEVHAILALEARIQALETSLEEAEGTIAVLRERLANSMPIAGGNPFRSAGGSATALETGEWKK